MSNTDLVVSGLDNIKIRHNPVFWVSITCIITGIAIMIGSNFL